MHAAEVTKTPRRPFVVVVVLLLVAAIATAVLAASSSPNINRGTVESLVRAVVRELHAGAAIPASMLVDGRLPIEAEAQLRDAATLRVTQIATGEALEILQRNNAAIFDIETSGEEPEVATESQSDHLIVDLLQGDDTRLTARGRIHGYTAFQIAGSGRVTRAQSWEYFDVTLAKVDGRWLISEFRVIPTLSDEKEIAPYPANGDPAGGDPAG